MKRENAVHRPRFFRLQWSGPASESSSTAAREAADGRAQCPKRPTPWGRHTFSLGHPPANKIPTRLKIAVSRGIAVTAISCRHSTYSCHQRLVRSIHTRVSGAPVGAMAGDACGRGVRDALAAVSAPFCQPESTQPTRLTVTRDPTAEIALMMMKMKMKMKMKLPMKQKKPKPRENHSFQSPN